MKRMRIFALWAGVFASACSSDAVGPQDGGVARIGVAQVEGGATESRSGGGVSSLSVEAARLEVGSSLQLVAYNRNGEVVQARWSTSDASVATVSSSGLVRGGAAGTATISAQTKGPAATAVITVVAGADGTAGTAGCIQLESQSWWSETTSIPLGGESEHVHTQVCFPYQQVIDGLWTFRIVSRLHNVPGWYLRHVRVQAASDQDGSRTLKTLSFRDRRCDARDCTFATDVTVDLSVLAAGEWEFRFHSEIRPAVDTVVANLATNGWLACVRSCDGRTPQAVPSGQTEGRGWYRDDAGEERGYVNARFVDPLPVRPVSGTWCPHVRTRRGTGDEPVTDSFVSIDPGFHASPENRGRVLLDAAGSLDGRLCIDTTALTNGTHKLFIRADWSGGPLAGALVVPFAVSNP